MLGCRAPGLPGCGCSLLVPTTASSLSASLPLAHPRSCPLRRLLSRSSAQCSAQQVGGQRAPNGAGWWRRRCSSGPTASFECLQMQSPCCNARCTHRGTQDADAHRRRHACSGRTAAGGRWLAAAAGGDGRLLSSGRSGQAEHDLHRTLGTDWRLLMLHLSCVRAAPSGGGFGRGCKAQRSSGGQVTL